MKKLLTTAAVAALLVTPALADNTDTENVTVGGSVITPLELGVTNNLIMPDVVLPNSATDAADTTTSVQLACSLAGAETVTYAGGGNPYARGGTGNNDVAAGANIGDTLGNSTGTCAELSVTGQSDYNFQVDLTANAIDAPNAAVVSLGSLACTDDDGNAITNGTSVALTGTDATLFCGATVTVSAVTATNYTGSFDVTVTYD